MNPEDLWNSTLNPETRTLVQVKADDLSEETINYFMNSNKQYVDRRKVIMLNNQGRVEDLDI